MKLWRFTDPSDYSFARASRRGTWDEETDERIQPLLIHWDPGSDVIGDFSWPGLGDEVMVTDRVGKALRKARISGFELGPVKMVKQTAASKRKRVPRVRTPYRGPKLWDLWPTAWVKLDLKRSSVKARRLSDGTRYYEASGIEQLDGAYRLRRRVKGKGLFVATKAGVFRITEFPRWIFCTDKVKQLIEAHEFSNVAFREMGDVL